MKRIRLIAISIVALAVTGISEQVFAACTFKHLGRCHPNLLPMRAYCVRHIHEGFGPDAEDTTIHVRGGTNVAHARAYADYGDGSVVWVRQGGCSKYRAS
jgi:hypothetical protein